jgi:prophage regulatory protein
MLLRTQAKNTRPRKKPAPDPTAALWRLPAVCAYTQFSRSTLLRKVERREFPLPIRLGPNSIAWLSVEVIAWKDDRIAERDQVAA